MTAKTLEQEAMEAAEVAFPPGTGRLGGKLYAGKPAKEGFRERSWFQKGYLAAATARDKEIAALRRKLCNAQGDLLIQKSIESKLVVAYDKEIASLQARIAELEAQVDDCEEKMSHVPAGFFA
jgi:hypothetical protein